VKFSTLAPNEYASAHPKHGRNNPSSVPVRQLEPAGLNLSQERSSHRWFYASQTSPSLPWTFLELGAKGPTRGWTGGPLSLPRQPAGVSRQPLAVAGSVRSLDEAVGARIALANCLPGGVGLSGEALVGN
jgi:hypothetical protein